MISSDWLALGAGIMLLGMLLNYALTHDGGETSVAVDKSRSDGAQVYETGYVPAPRPEK